MKMHAASFYFSHLCQLQGRMEGRIPLSFHFLLEEVIVSFVADGRKVHVKPVYYMHLS